MNPPALRVLWLEDSPDDFEVLSHRLGQALPVEAVRVYDGETLGAALEREGWDVMLADWTLPGFSAPAALSMLADRGLDLPCIVVTGVVGLIAEQAAVIALKAGAADFVLKDRVERLPFAIRREVELARQRRPRSDG